MQILFSELKPHDVVFFGATNRLQDLDDAFKSRITEKIEVDLPNGVLNFTLVENKASFFLRFYLEYIERNVDHAVRRST